METVVRKTNLPTSNWILPENEEIPIGGPTKRVYILVIMNDLNIALEFLLASDIPMDNFFDALLIMAEGSGWISHLDNSYLYFKNVEVDIVNGNTESHPSGSTFIFSEESKKPIFHSGKLWQCESCTAGFNGILQLINHMSLHKHKLKNYNVPTSWGPQEEKELCDQDVNLAHEAEDGNLNVEDDEKINHKCKTEKDIILPSHDSEEELLKEERIEDLSIVRREKMAESARRPKSILDVFVQNDDDKDWLLKVARFETVTSSAIFKQKQFKMAEGVKQAIKQGGQISKEGEREITGTWDVMKYCLPKVVQKYQIVVGRTLHFSDFFAFGTDELVELQDPNIFLRNWDGINADSRSNFLSAHVLLWTLVLDDVKSLNGQQKFQRRYIGDKNKLPKAAQDQERYINALERIKKDIKEKNTWSILKTEAYSKRCEMDILKKQLLTPPESMQRSIKEAVDVYLSSDHSQNCEKLLISSSQQGSVPLEDKDFLDITRHVVLRIQIISGGRTNTHDMTMGEWHNREIREDGNVIIGRTFSKVEKLGTDNFILLGPVEFCLCLHYESVRQIKFPYMSTKDDSDQQSFFLNSIGTTYIGKSGSKGHLSKWSEITGRTGTITDFRRNMSDWSLSTDLVTRANTAFVNNHSTDMMIKVYASKDKKREKGIEALLQYRLKGLEQSYLKHASLFKIQLPKDFVEKQTKRKLLSYDSSLKKIVQYERNLLEAQHDNVINKHASNESRAAFLEAITEERKSGAVNKKRGYLADKLLVRPKPYDKKDKIISNVLELVDSPQYANNPAVISLNRILIRAAGQMENKKELPISEFIKEVENSVVYSWILQIENLARPGSKLIEFRNFASFQKISSLEDVGGVQTYCLNNKTIENQVQGMIDSRNSLMSENNDKDSKKTPISAENFIKNFSRAKNSSSIDSKLKEENNNEAETTSQTMVLRSSEKSKIQKTLFSTPEKDSAVKSSPKRLFATPENNKSIIESASPYLKVTKTQTMKTPKKQKYEKTRESPRLKPYDVPKLKDSESPKTPPPIQLRRTSLLKRKPLWNKEDRKTLLEHILKNMSDPTLPKRREGMDDLKENVFKKVSPVWNEEPEMSRSIDDIIDQYYR